MAYSYIEKPTLNTNYSKRIGKVNEIQEVWLCIYYVRFIISQNTLFSFWSHFNFFFFDIWKEKFLNKNYFSKAHDI